MWGIGSDVHACVAKGLYPESSLYKGAAAGLRNTQDWLCTLCHVVLLHNVGMLVVVAVARCCLTGLGLGPKQEMYVPGVVGVLAVWLQVFVVGRCQGVTRWIHRLAGREGDSWSSVLDVKHLLSNSFHTANAAL